MRSSHTFTAESAVFDEMNLVSAAGLVPVMELAEQTGLSGLISEHVTVNSVRVASGAVNPAGKLTSLIGAMLCGGDHIDHADLLRAGGTATVFGEVYAPSTLGIFLREFSFGHAQQVAAVARRHLIALARRAPMLVDPAAERVYVDIDSALRPVYGHAKQGASFGHSKIAGRVVLRRGLSPLLTTLSTDTSAPVIAEMRLRAGRAGSARGAASQVAAAIGTARECGARKILLRGDSAFGSKKIMRTAIAAGAEFSLTLARNRAIDRAIAAIGDDAWEGVKYPGAVRDPETGEWISDAEVAETVHTISSGRDAITVRLIVRRVKDAAVAQEPLFPVWRYHPFATNSDLSTVDADLVHRRHAIIETVISDVIDGPLAHLPSGYFPANTVWAICAQIAHNLARAAATLTGSPRHAVARGATLRRDLINVPARFARPARKPVLHLPDHWPWEQPWKTLWHTVFGITAATTPAPS